MEESDETGIQLNIFSSGGSGKSSQQRVKGTRAERIKQRRFLKHQKQLDNLKLTGEYQGPAIISVPGKQNAGQDKRTPVLHSQKGSESRSQAGRPAAPKPTTAIISSLFRSNPEIPVVKKSEVLPLNEKVFSSTKFSDLPLHPYLSSILEDKLGLSQMTSVQQRSIPHILNGEDALIRSQTGSGKTLTYAIPIVQMLQKHEPKVQRSDGPYALIIVPTRELAIQSFQTFQKIVKPFTWIVPGCIMGGEKRKAEKARLRKGINILLGTPGRLVDHLNNTKSLLFNRLRWLVIDEADRLLDMGFEKSVAEVMDAIKTRSNHERQTILLSATLSKGVERLAGISLHEPRVISLSKDDSTIVNAREDCDTDISITDSEETYAVPDSLQQYFVIVPCKLRLVTMTTFILWKSLLSKQKNKMVVFVSTQDSVEFCYNLFLKAFCNKSQTFDMDSDFVQLDKSQPMLELFKLHGDMPQKERTKVFQEFCNSLSGILLCTDVAARGLHLPNVKWIVQYTTPGVATDYIHRIGRTARAGSAGNALLFLMPHEVDYIKVLNRHKISLQEMPMKDIMKQMPALVNLLPLSSETRRQHPRTYEEAATYIQLYLENMVNTDTEQMQAARKAYQSFIRSYATYPVHLKSIFQVRLLHLGHTAKSFCLREAPKVIGVQNSNVRAKGAEKKGKEYNRLHTSYLPQKRKARISEYDSGLSPGKRKKAKQKGTVYDSD